MKPIFLVAMLALLGYCFGEDRKESFHVSSVKTEDARDWCTTGKCSAERFTVEGYIKGESKLVEYVLECVETIANEPSPHYTVICIHVHANNDYAVKVGTDSVLFEHEPPSGDALVSAYRIISEKEAPKR